MDSVLCKPRRTATELFSRMKSCVFSNSPCQHQVTQNLCITAVGQVSFSIGMREAVRRTFVIIVRTGASGTAPARKGLLTPALGADTRTIGSSEYLLLRGESFRAANDHRAHEGRCGLTKVAGTQHISLPTIMKPPRFALATVQSVLKSPRKIVLFQMKSYGEKNQKAAGWRIRSLRPRDQRHL
jgi:hypothetical protein